MHQQENSYGYPANKIEEISDSEELEGLHHDVENHDSSTEASAPVGEAEDEAIFATDEELNHQNNVRESSKTCATSDFDESSDPLNKTTQRRTIEITLRADSEFFNLLTKELEQIDKVQAKQKELLTTQVKSLGKNITTVARPGGPGRSSDLYTWREIFSLYRDAAIFFSTTERDHGSRNAEEARKRMQWFQDQLSKTPTVNLRQCITDLRFKN